MTLFVEFPKIARLNRDIFINEKIDGTNAQIEITEDGDIRAGSRNRFVTPLNDNYGFARWVEGERQELLKLGPGRHYGEWWGSGIQRAYGLKGGEKRFSLFNVARWSDDAARPACCRVVPTLYHGPFDSYAIDTVMTSLRLHGSRAEPGFMRPEGVIVYHTASGTMFKATLENDASPKSMVEPVRMAA